MSHDPVHHPAHYERGSIQPHVFIRRNDLLYFEGAIIEYVYRWDAKGGLRDLHKAFQCLAFVMQDRVDRPAYARPRDGVSPAEFFAANSFLGDHERAIITGVYYGCETAGLSHLERAQHHLNALIRTQELPCCGGH